MWWVGSKSCNSSLHSGWVTRVQKHAYVYMNMIVNWKFDLGLFNNYVDRKRVESFQDILIKLDMKTPMHLVEISIFSLNNVTGRLTKIMNNLLEYLKILIFKFIFQCGKLIASFQKKFSLKNIRLGGQLLIKKYFENFDF